jgi:hypothetical protein
VADALELHEARRVMVRMRAHGQPEHDCEGWPDDALVSRLARRRFEAYRVLECRHGARVRRMRCGPDGGAASAAVLDFRRQGTAAAIAGTLTAFQRRLRVHFFSHATRHVRAVDANCTAVALRCSEKNVTRRDAGQH